MKLSLFYENSTSFKKAMQHPAAREGGNQHYYTVIIEAVNVEYTPSHQFDYTSPDGKGDRSHYDPGKFIVDGIHLDMPRIMNVNNETVRNPAEFFKNMRLNKSNVV